MSDPIGDRYLRDAKQVAKSGAKADVDYTPLRPTKGGTATRAEGRREDIRRYRKEIEKAKRKKKMLKRFKKESKIGYALGRLDEKIRFFTDMISRTKRVGNRDYPEIFDDVRAVIVELSSDRNNSEIAELCGVNRSVIAHLRAGSHREVSKHTAHNVYEMLIGVQNRDA